MRTGRARPSRGESENPHKLREDGRPLSPAGGAPPPPSPPAVPPSLSLRREDVGQGPPAPMPPPPARPLPSPTFNYETQQARWAQPKDPQRSRGLQRQALVTPGGPLGHVPHGRDTPLPSHSCLCPLYEWPRKVTANRSLQDMLPLVPSPLLPFPTHPTGSLHLSPSLSLSLSPPFPSHSPSNSGRLSHSESHVGAWPAHGETC